MEPNANFAIDKLVSHQLVFRLKYLVYPERIYIKIKIE